MRYYLSAKITRRESHRTSHGSHYDDCPTVSLPRAQGYPAHEADAAGHLELIGPTPSCHTHRLYG